MNYDRRQMMTMMGLGAATLGFVPRIAFAKAPGETRFLFIIQRGAADGLALLSPHGDPAYQAARGAIADREAGLKIDSMFSLHPALTTMADMYGKGEAMLGHALATNYRDRSHFDVQNVLETGGTAPYAEKTGWMNRMLGLFPGEQVKALALAPTIPPSLRGPNDVTSYAPSNLKEGDADLMGRISTMYAGDAQLGGLWGQAMETSKMAGEAGDVTGRRAEAVGQLIVNLMKPTDGARVMMVETTGWDTHTGQNGRLNALLKGLDTIISNVRTGMGPLWSQTMIVVATEFGRTVAGNGTGGTDHGTASAAFALGGGIGKSRIVSDWPGLAPSAQFEGRDLKPTAALEGFIVGRVAQHFQLDPAQVAKTLYPSLSGLKALV